MRELSIEKETQSSTQTYQWKGPLGDLKQMSK